METVGSVEGRSTPNLGRFFRKRKPVEEHADSGEEPEDAPRSRVLSPKRGRGRPPTTGEYVGLAAVKAEYLKLKEDELRLSAEEEVAELASRARLERAAKEHAAPAPEEELSCQLNKRVLGDIEVILKVAQKSQNLKGTFQKALKEAAASIAAAVKEFSSRTTSEELERVQAAYTSLEARHSKQAEELSTLRKELAELRAEVGKGRCSEPVPVPIVDRTAKAVSPPVPKRLAMAREEFPPLPKPRQLEPQIDPSAAVTVEVMDQAMQRMMNIMTARLDSFQDRLLPEKRLRPPLAADRVTARTTANDVAAQDAQPPKVHASQQAAGVKGRRKAANKPGSEHPVPSSAASRKQPPAPKPTEGEWVLVGKNGRPKKPAKNKKKPPSRKAKTQKLRPPKTTAVSVTLRPEAEQKGLSYLEVLKGIKAHVNLADIGIPGIKWRKAATGGYLLEIPGANSGDKADALAAKIKEAVPPEGVRVSRPMRCADVRISGLDESVTAEEVIAAVAQTTGCPPDQVKTNGVRPGLRGLWTSVVSCPVDVAKTLGDGRRLLIGWVSAQVKVLPPRSLRCFRCLQDGHLGVKCTCQVDCSQLCFRCSQPGHKAGGCSADPHCAVCAAANKPAGHRVGSRACSKPATSPKKGRRRRGGNKGKNPSQPPTLLAVAETPTTSQATEMECQQ